MKFRIAMISSIDNKSKIASEWYDASKFSISKLLEAVKPFEGTNWMLEYKNYD